LAEAHEQKTETTCIEPPGEGKEETPKLLHELLHAGALIGS